MRKTNTISNPIFKIILATATFVALALAPGSTYFYFTIDDSFVESMFFTFMYTLLWTLSIAVVVWILLVLIIFIQSRLKTKKERKQGG